MSIGMAAIRLFVLLLLWAVILAPAQEAQPVGRRRALLIGINDYTASRLGHRPRPSAPGREWWDLDGSVNDVGVLQQMLVLLYGFEPAEVVVLKDQEATRAAIFQAIDRHLVRPSSKHDVVLFYYSGHGSQVVNSRSDEPDRLDETIVPADSRLGAPDIRDKELRVLFNRILSRGAKLTVVLDNCHSGSGARGLPSGARPRGLQRDARDVVDAANYGPRPEDRGALVLTASQDMDAAWETRDEDGTIRGAFSWALIRAMRDSAAGESASETFRRARARLRAETPFQEPVMAGNASARLSPLFGTRTDRRGDRTVIAVENVLGDGTVVLQGGWANGLSVGSELRIVSDRQLTVRLTVTAIRGLGRSEARVQTGRTIPQAIQSGALLEVVAWTAPHGQPLRVWAPRVSGSTRDISALARRIADTATRRSVRWVSDPTEVTPTHLLRRDAHGWQMLGPAGRIDLLGDDGAAVAGVARIPAGSSLFVQFPVPSALIDGIAIGPGTDREGIVQSAQAIGADYVLAGRYVPSSRRLEYAWVRPGVKSADRHKTGLPIRTDWVFENERDQTLRDSVVSLREDLLRLRRIHGWLLLTSPGESRFPYRLGVRRRRDARFVKGPPFVSGDESYELVLQTASPTAHIAPRYVYVFIIDSYGKSFLAYPRWGSVENRLPAPGRAPAEIPLGDAGSFNVLPPYGIDTYFLLTTEVPLTDPWILEWDGVRSRSVESPAPLEELLMLTASGTRAGKLVTPAGWSLDKYVFESLPPRHKRRVAVSD